MNASTFKQLSDDGLLPFIKDGNISSFSELFLRFKHRLFLHAYRMLQNEEEAQDVVQDLFATIWAQGSNFKVTENIDNYLYGATKNKVLDIIAHKKVMVKYSNSFTELVVVDDSAHDKYVEKELRAMIESEISHLPKKMREVFELSRYEGLSHKQIAEKLDISDKTVKKQISNVLKILRTKIKVTILFFY
ncbi:RNA polymerase sigma-70 factor [Pedobacter sp. MC2016-14]|uniref:RNA polymerase sigma factor n=1 Tax=Pedobacter sp. MC2016-14 TaxID=2897327 RepID=UPI001E48B025|nr:RNA polymerase sigma-70 factor [Pedobacter sp. MC2016-14]MCD0489689.1 RNA polymerase sigma-70 factor [Pedobacter sp. MC2016-14]